MKLPPSAEELEDIKATANMLVFSGFKIISETPESDGQASVTFSYVAALANPVGEQNRDKQRVTEASVFERRANSDWCFVRSESKSGETIPA
jgi:hypothetical protein